MKKNYAFFIYFRLKTRRWSNLDQVLVELTKVLRTLVRGVLCKIGGQMTRVLLSFLISSFLIQTTVYAHEEIEDGSSVLSPEQEEQYSEDMQYFRKMFPQTTWKECTDYITGNYSGYNCSNRRGISVILKSFMDTHFLTCTNEALKNFNGKTAIDLHVQHDGIQGDARHSPRSLHAEARAVDVDSMVVTYSGGVSERLSFKGTKHQAFYNSFRSCWGEKVRTHNGCPIAGGSISKTGSIGKEDRNHQNHLHVSVPYCVSGRYSSSFFQR